MFKVILVAAAILATVNAAGNSQDADAVILKYENEIRDDGSYNYAYQTSNQIQASENGVGSTYASGSYSYTAPDGQPIQLTYTADENGFQPRGDHLPTPPPIPDYILKALKYIEEHPFNLAKK